MNFGKVKVLREKHFLKRITPASGGNMPNIKNMTTTKSYIISATCSSKLAKRVNTDLNMSYSDHLMTINCISNHGI